MPLQIVREDIVKMKVDAIVAAGSAKPGTPAPTGGVNGRIHQKAGARLLEALRRMGGIRTAEVTLTQAFDLPCRYVMHTAGPVWRGGTAGEEKQLRACYCGALELAESRGLSSIAFPLISTGKYGYPKAEAMRVATEEIRSFLTRCDMLVYLVVYDGESFRLSGELFDGVEQFIDQHYVDRHYVVRKASEDGWAHQSVSARPMEAPRPCRAPAPAGDDMPRELDRRLRQLDEGFSRTVLRLIDERGMTDPECYRRANLDRKLFSKIRSNPGYTPRKPTAVALCIALELDLPQTQELLSRAGYGMSRASKFDVIVEYFIARGVFDVHTINQALWHYDQPLLGSLDKEG